MNVIEIKDGVVLGDPECKYTASVSRVPDGFWVSLGYPNEQGMLISSDDWSEFYDLVLGVDNYLNEEYNG